MFNTNHRWLIVRKNAELLNLESTFCYAYITDLQKSRALEYSNILVYVSMYFIHTSIVLLTTWIV